MAGQPYYYYYGTPQRPYGSDGQYLAQPAPGTGVYPTDGSAQVNPMTGVAFPVGTAGTPISPSIPVQLPYFVNPPAASQSLDILTTNVVAVNTATGTTAGTSGATILANSYAFNLNGVTITPLTPSSVSSTVSLLAYNAVSPGVFQQFGVHVWSAQGLKAIRVQVQINGTNFPGLTETELSHFFEGNYLSPIFVPFNKQDVIQILARNIDLQSSYLVTARLKGYRYSGV